MIHGSGVRRVSGIGWIQDREAGIWLPLAVRLERL
jgi:hypothetical protein